MFGKSWFAPDETHFYWSREEVNESVKLEIVRCLGLWASALETLPTIALELLTKGLKDKEALQKAHLCAILQVGISLLLDTIISISYQGEGHALAPCI